MSSSIVKFALVGFAAMVLAACEGTFGSRDEGQPAAIDSSSTSATTSTLGTGTIFQGHMLDDPAGMLSKRTVYFDFDSSEVVDSDRAIIEAHARYLADHPGATVVLEGHTDERGTREYNLALGERRSSSVNRLMNLLGAGGQQVRQTSYGKERPAVEGHDESAWRYNRRVEIIYSNRG